ncbi:G-protein coupled receptors family 1 profile domain-containing protein [Caenorhabditis elegans]|uniref:G-protein coupled receptors family 1 profile domain-containing protein n=1 Tax=Caenorhabditis elegans TaxID=6239 RepID=Q86DC8_CAEEL|nr:G-protein coupled receptors family 1 profile domain-containing protein [Caenorhabditis elegans]CCD72067.1 G-protein coupled receptors family 1 profile domain-containing protein [Caenorhabditis elegans]|eukprot:NP_001023383.1 Serpentine Receptor, class V [Caenorhabditis elegans]
MESPPAWPLYVYYGMSILSLPLYFGVLICLLRLRYFSKTYKTTFYTILLQHCIADIISMTVFTVIWAIRMLPGLKEFYFHYQEYYIAAGTYNSIYYFLYIRCAGIVFLSIHRYLVISAPTSRITMRIQEAATWQIVLVYWIVPTLISLIVLKDTDFHYDALETMEVVAPRAIITRNTLMALIIVALTCFICVLSYLALFLFLRKHSAGFSKNLQRELHLAFQVLALLCAFFVMFAYYIFQNYFSQTQNTGPIYTMRALYPIANGTLSYINPFCILLLNRDFSRQFMRTLKCEKVRVSEIQVSTVKSLSTQRK